MIEKDLGKNMNYTGKNVICDTIPVYGGLFLKNVVWFFVF